MGACFGAGTPILTPDGHKSIEDFKVGDLVLSRPDHDPFHPPRAKPVVATLVNESRIVEVHVAGHIIRTNPEHPFFVKGRGWTEAAQLDQSSVLISHNNRWVPVERIVFTDEVEKVYNIAVEDDRTYYVGEQGWPATIWAHKARCGSTGSTGASPGPSRS